MDGQHTFYGKAKNPECRNRCFLGAGLWIPCAVPSVGVLCSRAWWEASFRKPLGFRRCLPPARPEKAKPFQAGQSPCTKHLQTVRLRLYAPKKVFEGSKGRFFKNASWQGVGQRPTKGGQATHRGTPFQAGRSPCTKHQQTVRLCLYAPKKVFEGSKGRFFKNAPWQGMGRSSTKRGQV